MFITLCGGEGSGKSTQIKNISKYLTKNQIDHILTREPGATKIGKQIRKILLDPENKDLDPIAELFLYSADRIQHIKEIIIPSLQANKTVICDRFADCTTAYQGYARGIDLDLVNRLNEIVVGGIKPDITFLLDISPEIGLSRTIDDLKKGKRKDNETRFEQELINFHNKIRNGYRTLAKKEKERFCIIDASKTSDKVEEEIINVLKQSFKLI